jgi:hypothetical protein
VPRIQFDYGFLGLGDEGIGHLLTMIVGKDQRTGSLGGAIVESKGNQAYACASINEYLDELGYLSMEVQVDGEPAFQALMHGVIAERIKKYGKEAAQIQIRLRVAPKDSHASQGSVDSGIKTVAGLSRTARFSLEKKFGIKIVEDMPVVPWMIRHQIFCYNRFQKRRSSGRTPFEELRISNYKPPLLEFGEIVMVKDKVELTEKWGSAWIKGVWLGRSKKSDAHLIGTATEFVMARTVKPLPSGEDTSMDHFKAMRWTPWKPSTKSRNLRWGDLGAYTRLSRVRVCDKREAWKRTTPAS